MPAIRAVVAVLLMGVAAPAAATFHLMLIREVYVGPVDDADAQYVELQMYAGGQNQVQGHSLTFYGPTGTLVGTVTFPTDVPNGSPQDSILVATTEAETRFVVDADRIMAPLMDPAGGKVCFDNIDCFSWGTFSGNGTTPSPSGNPFNPVGGLTPDSAALRDISGGGSATDLEAADDTNDSAADFDFAGAPDPTSNATGAPCDPEAYDCDEGGGGGGGGGPLGWSTSLLLLALGLARRGSRGLSGR